MYRVGDFEEGLWVLQPSWCLVAGNLVVGMMASEERSRGKSVVLLLLELTWCSNSVVFV